MALSNLEALLSALVFSGIFFFGAKVRLPQKGERYYRRFVSLSAGVGLAYVFLQLLPELYAARQILLKSSQHFSTTFDQYRLYIAALTGFIFFYGLHNLLPVVQKRSVEQRMWWIGNWPFHMYMAGFFFYIWLVTYLRVHALEEVHGSNFFYTIAMGLHIFLIHFALDREYKEIYRKQGKNLLACAALLGWTVGVFLVLPLKIVMGLAGFLAGGIIMNTMIMEMPRERESRFFYFLIGVVFYSGLILLSR